jgi:hypothetical protein
MILRNLKHWSLLIAAVAAGLIGCAGSGGGCCDTGSTTGTTSVTTGTTSSGMAVNLPNTPALVNIGFLTGQGRAPGDTFGVITNFSLEDSTGRTDSTGNARRLLLRGYEFQIMPLNVDVGFNNSRTFNFLDIDVDRLEIDNGVGNPPTLLSPIFGIPYRAPSRVTAFTGRHTTVPIFLDDAMLYQTISPEILQPATFDRAQFDIINLAPEDPRILAFISDYVSFDISEMDPADRPLLGSGTPASRVFFSGDGYGISEAGNAGVFEALTLDEFSPFEGRFKGPGVIAGQRTPGTYSLIQPDPSDLTGLAKITSLQGIWRPYTEVLSNVGSFEVLSFPNSNETGRQDVVAFARIGGRITNFYFGEANFEDGTLNLWPIRNIVDAAVDGEITGTVSNLRDRSGVVTTLPAAVRRGSFSLSGVLPAGFSNSGTFLVFRR